MINKNALFYLSIVTLCIIIYFKCLFFGITNSDDQVLIGDLPVLSHFSNIFRVFTTDAFYLVKSIDLYRPLQSLTYIIDAQWGGGTLFFVHLTNVLLHILCCLVVYHLLMRLEFPQPLAFTGALIYAVHYLFMTAVVWIPARGDLLLALCSFLALLTLIKSLEQPTWRNITAHLLLFTLALFSKESGIFLPLLFAIYLLTHSKITQLTGRHILLPIYYVVVGSLYWLLKGAAVRDSGAQLGLVQFMKNLHQLPEMVTKFYLPLNMSTLPAYRLSTTLIGIIIIAVLLALYLFCLNVRQKKALFYPSWFLIFILPGMSYYPYFYSFSNEHIDHRSYLICFGLLMTNLFIVQQFAMERRKYFTVVVIIFLGYLSICNLYLSPNYRNASAFALQAIKMGSNSAKAYANYGAEKYLQGDESEALVYLNKSLQMYNENMPALNYRARIFANRGMYQEALADLDNIISNAPEYYANAYLLRGMIKSDLNDYKGAEADYNTALRIEPEPVGIWVAIGRLRQLQGRMVEACSMWSSAAEKGDSDAVELSVKYCQ